MNECNDLNQRIGFWSISDGDGKKWFKGNYVDGKKDGEWIHFDKDGNENKSYHNHQNETTIHLCSDHF